MRPRLWLRPLPAGRRPAHRPRAGQDTGRRRRAHPVRLPPRPAHGGSALHLCGRQEPAGRGPMQGGPVDRMPHGGPAARLPRSPCQMRRQPGGGYGPHRPRRGHPRRRLQGRNRRRQEGGHLVPQAQQEGAHHRPTTSDFRASSVGYQKNGR